MSKKMHENLSKCRFAEPCSVMTTPQRQISVLFRLAEAIITLLPKLQLNASFVIVFCPPCTIQHLIDRQHYKRAIRVLNVLCEPRMNQLPKRDFIDIIGDVLEINSYCLDSCVEVRCHDGTDTIISACVRDHTTNQV